MADRGRPGDRPGPSLRGMVLGCLALLPLLVVGLASGPATAAASYSPPVGSPTSWTNGQVLCQFAPGSPSVGVAASALPGSGITLSAMSMSERSSAGAVVATADLNGSVWNVTNRSTEDAYDLAYTIHAPMTAAGAPATAIGSADLRVDFVLPAYDGSPDGPPNVVSVVLSVANWTWQSAGDHLALVLEARASSPSSEHLAATTATGWLVVSASNSSGSELDSVGMNESAATTSSTGGSQLVPAQGSLTVTSPSLAQITVDFGAAAGEFHALAFTARVGVVLPSEVAGIPVPDLIAVGAAATVVSAGVALTVGRLRRRPSRLVYVEEEA